MGVETMIALIERDAADEAVAMIRDAQADAARIVAEAEARSARRVADALERAGPALRGEATRRVNAARLRRLERRAATVSSWVAQVFDIAERRVADIAEGDDPARWEAAVRGLASHALGAVGGGRLAVRETDAALVVGLVTACGGVLEPLPAGAPAGVRVRSGDGRLEVDATLPVRMERARRHLADAVLETLGLGTAVAP